MKIKLVIEGQEQEEEVKTIEVRLFETSDGSIVLQARPKVPVGVPKPFYTSILSIGTDGVLRRFRGLPLSLEFCCSSLGRIALDPDS